MQSDFHETSFIISGEKETAKTERLSNVGYDFLDKLEIRCSMQRYSSEQAFYSPFSHEYAGLFWKMIDCWHLVSLDVKKEMAILDSCKWFVLAFLIAKPTWV